MPKISRKSGYDHHQTSPVTRGNVKIRVGSGDNRSSNQTYVPSGATFFNGKNQREKEGWPKSLEDDVEKGHTEDFHIDESGTIQFHNQFYVPTNTEIWEEILKEVYRSPYSIHSGGKKNILRPQDTLLWAGMKKDIGKYISQYLIRQQAKTEHSLPTEKLQSLQIPIWKTDNIAMHDTVWVIVDKLTMSAHFLSIHTT